MFTLIIDGNRLFEWNTVWWSADCLPYGSSISNATIIDIYVGY